MDIKDKWKSEKEWREGENAWRPVVYGGSGRFVNRLKIKLSLIKVSRDYKYRFRDKKIKHCALY